MNVSVIIPVFNRRDRIGETLRAIERQTSRADQVVVVDDGSTDGTLDHVRREFPWVDTHRIDNSGPVVARKFGIERSRHDWVALCDSDDVWRPDHLERRRRAHARHPAAEISCGNCLVRDERSGRAEPNFAAAPAGYWEALGRRVDDDLLVADRPPYRHMVDYLPVFPSTLLFTRKAYERAGGFDPSFTRVVSEDFEFSLRCAEQAPWIVDMQQTVTIRKHGMNLSRDRVQVVLGDLLILEHAARHHASGREHAQLIARVSSRKARYALDLAFASGDMDAVRALARYLRSEHRDARALAKMALSRMPQRVAAPIASRIAG